MPKKSQAVEQEQKEEKIISMPKKKRNNAKKQNASIGSKAFVWGITAFIVITFFTNVFLRAEISKVGSELSKAEVIGNQLKSEETRLSVELEKKTSVGNLEKQAEKLGMQKPDKTQIHYIFNYDDEIQVETADVE